MSLSCFSGEKEFRVFLGNEENKKDRLASPVSDPKIS
jgi:hypothetical protein